MRPMRLMVICVFLQNSRECTLKRRPRPASRRDVRRLRLDPGALVGAHLIERGKSVIQALVGRSLSAFLSMKSQ